MDLAEPDAVTALRRPRLSRHARRPRRATATALALLTFGSAAMTRYAVRPGDTLSAVARRVHVSVRDLTVANHIRNPDHIEAGQVLLVPAPGVPATVAAAGAAASPAGTLPARLLAHRSRLALRPAFRAWSAAYGVPADLVEALAWMESGWQDQVVSPTGAIGIGQLEPTTVAFVCGVLLHHKLNPRVAVDNIRMTARLLRHLLDATGGDVAAAVGAYYQGLDSMRAQGPLGITRVYVAGVLALRRAFAPG